MVREVRILSSALRSLRAQPSHVGRRLQGWVKAVKESGLEEVRKVPGCHDEPLEGRLRGERSIRLSRAIRAVYTIERDATGEYAWVKRIGTHDEVYRR